MRAIVFTEYGSPDVLRLAEVERPVPADDEVLIQVRAVSLNEWDWGALQGADVVNRLLFGLRRPRKKRQILGSDVAGRVEAVGRNVRRFQRGDEVFGDLSGRWGGFAEFVCAPEKALALKAPGMTFEQAAAIPQAALLAVQALRDLGRIRPGQTLLVNGAGGGVGTFAIQIARTYGVEVTAVDSAEKLDMLLAMGAQHVLDYTREDFTRTGRRYDLILDVKTARSVADCARALNPEGTYVTVGGSMPRLFEGLVLWPWIALTTKKKIRLLALKPNKDLVDMRELFEAGKVVPVIDGSWGLADVPAAFRYFGTGRHRGKIVVTVDYHPVRRVPPMTTPLPDSAARVQEHLKAQGCESRVVELPAGTRTAVDAARAIGCDVSQIAKSVVFRAANSGRPVLVVASGSRRVDEAALAGLLGEPVGKASADFVREATGYAIGGVPPVAHERPPVTFLDAGLLELSTIWAAAGTPTTVFSLSPAELVRLTGGQVANVTS